MDPMSERDFCPSLARIIPAAFGERSTSWTVQEEFTGYGSLSQVNVLLTTGFKLMSMIPPIVWGSCRRKGELFLMKVPED